MRTRSLSPMLARALAPALLLAAAACGAVPFDVDQDIAEQKVQGNPNPLAQLCPSSVCQFFDVPLQVNLQAEEQKRNTGPAHAAHLKSLTLAATPHDKPSGNWDFLDSASIVVSASGLPDKEVANLPSVAKGQTTLTFNVVPDVDLLPYINAGATITSKASGHQPQQDFTFDGHVTITVTF